MSTRCGFRPVFLFLQALLLVGLASCNVLGLQTSTPASSLPTPTNLSQTAALPPQATPTNPPPNQLILWLPASFDPNLPTPAGQVLAARIQQFEQQHNLTIQVRIKAVSGPDGLLNALSATAPAAPAALPDLIALPRTDLEIAAIKNLIYSLDEQSEFSNDPDWYPYAQQLASVQGSTFGIPFAGDAIVLLYRPSKTSVPASDWEEVLRQSQPVLFAAGDPRALHTLALYQAAGGNVEDMQSRPTLSSDALEAVLRFYDLGGRSGLFSYSLTQLRDEPQAWQFYSEQRGHRVITWSSYYLSTRPADTTITNLPAFQGQSVTSPASAWLWASASPDPARRALAIALAEDLSESNFQAQWTTASGYLPTRPSALNTWQDPSLRTIYGLILPTAQALPRNDLLSVLGPALEQATQQVLRQESDPLTAAQAAIQRLQNPQP